MQFFGKNFFNQSPLQKNSYDTCDCKSNNGLFLDRAYVSRLVAVLLLIGSLIFIAGYFVGQRSAVDQFINASKQESFADQLYYSMCSLYDQPELDESDEAPEVAEEEPLVQEEIVATSAPEGEPEVLEETPVVEKAPQEVSESVERYYAQLVGFGKQKSAEVFVDKLAQKGITVVLNKRYSKTQKGATIPWYQVVTPEFSDKDAVEQFVASIRNYETLNDVRIVKK